MSDPSLDEIRKKIKQSLEGDLGKLAEATDDVITKLFEVIVKQELALRRVTLALAEDSDLRKRVIEDGLCADNHGAPPYQGTTIQDVLEWAKMGLE